MADSLYTSKFISSFICLLNAINAIPYNLILLSVIFDGLYFIHTGCDTNGRIYDLVDGRDFESRDELEARRCRFMYSWLPEFTC